MNKNVAVLKDRYMLTGSKNASYVLKKLDSSYDNCYIYDNTGQFLSCAERKNGKVCNTQPFRDGEIREYIIAVYNALCNKKRTDIKVGGIYKFHTNLRFNIPLRNYNNKEFKVLRIRPIKLYNVFINKIAGYFLDDYSREEIEVYDFNLQRI